MGDRAHPTNRPAPVTGPRLPASPDQPSSSKHGQRLLESLLALPPAVRRHWYAELDQRDWAQVLGVSWAQTGTRYGLWQDDPVGFVEDVLGETTWSKQREILEALRTDHRVTVPSCFGSGKTHIAARVAVWSACVWPPGTALTVTTATRWRQVQRQLWPHIRQLVARAGLPGQVGTAQWKMPSPDGQDVVVAYGFSAPAHDESAVQGIHAPRLMLIVDEAGGIGRVIGSAMRGLLTGSDTRALFIGNPPSDDEGSWFEQTCADPEVRVIRIRAQDTPLLSGETTAACRSCPPQVPAHSLATHLVDPQWVAGAIRDHGEDAPYVIAKVHADFPRGGSARAIPADWIQAAREAADPQGPRYLRLADLDPIGAHGEQGVERGAWVRLGVDVAAGGGDEFVIARAIGDLVTIQHTSAGAVNADADAVAAQVLAEIHAAQVLADALGSTEPVRVKVDAIGWGWGVAGLLRAWRRAGRHRAVIVPVIVSEVPGRTGQEESATLRPGTKRDEMWLATRALLAPAVQGLRLRVDDRTIHQLGAPRLSTDADGRTRIESKTSMSARGVSSPDRAEAVLLTVYEPGVRRRRVRLIA